MCLCFALPITLATMPKELTHSECRALLCIVCVKKKPCVRPISDDVKQLIETHYQAGLDFINDDRLPNKICGLCRLRLREIESGKRTEKLAVFNYKILHYPPGRRNGMYKGILGTILTRKGMLDTILTRTRVY